MYHSNILLSPSANVLFVRRFERKRLTLNVNVNKCAGNRKIYTLWDNRIYIVYIHYLSSKELQPVVFTFLFDGQMNEWMWWQCSFGTHHTPSSLHCIASWDGTCSSSLAGPHETSPWSLLALEKPPNDETWWRTTILRQALFPDGACDCLVKAVDECSMILMICCYLNIPTFWIKEERSRWKDVSLQGLLLGLLCVHRGHGDSVGHRWTNRTGRCVCQAGLQAAAVQYRAHMSEMTCCSHVAAAPCCVGMCVYTVRDRSEWWQTISSSLSAQQSVMVVWVLCFISAYESFKDRSPGAPEQKPNPRIGIIWKRRGFISCLCGCCVIGCLITLVSVQKHLKSLLKAGQC